MDEYTGGGSCRNSRQGNETTFKSPIHEPIAPALEAYAMYLHSRFFLSHKCVIT